MGSPHESSVEMFVKRFESAFGDGSNILIGEGSGIFGALSVLDDVVGGVSVMTIAIWTI